MAECDREESTKFHSWRVQYSIHKQSTSPKYWLLLIFFCALIRGGLTNHKCRLPKSWHGEWFHSGYTEPVVVNETSLGFKGTCVQNRKDRYLIENKVQGCFRCLVIHQKHRNVIQFKETFCSRTNSLETLCGSLVGDSPLKSLFRKRADPITCPFPHSYTFTYNRGNGNCLDPPSNVFSCTEDWRLLFQYQACPDVVGTESKTQELVCLAVWKEGSNQYLVGKSNYPHATSDEDRFRCFVYIPWARDGKSGFHLGVSGDATCNGLFSVYDGSRTLQLTKVDTSGKRCRYPSWVRSTHWHSLDGGTNLHITKHNTTLRLTGQSVSGGPATLACLKIEHVTQNSATFVTRVTHGCNSGYRCVQLLSRDSSVMEVNMGKVVPVADEACSKHFFDSSSTNVSTFVSASAQGRTCPEVGRYEVVESNVGQRKLKAARNVDSVDLTLGACEEGPFTSLTVGCSANDKLEIHTTCSHSVFSCHGWWREDGIQYLVVTPTSRSSKGFRRLCLVLNRGETGLSLASSANSCSRELVPGVHGHIALNTTNSGSCETVLPSSGVSAGCGVQYSITFLVLSYITALKSSSVVR